MTRIHIVLTSTVLQIRESSRVKNLRKLATWPDKINGKLETVWGDPHPLTPQNSLSTPCLYKSNVLRSNDGAVVRPLAPHQCGPGLKPRVDAIWGLSLLALVPALRVFHWVLRFSSLHKNQHFLNSNLTLKQWMKGHSVDMPLQIPI